MNKLDFSRKFSNNLIWMSIKLGLLKKALQRPVERIFSERKKSREIGKRHAFFASHKNWSVHAQKNCAQNELDAKQLLRCPNALSVARLS